RLDSRRVERQVADALAGRVGKGVGDGGDRGPLRAFARAERTLVRTVDQLDLDLRRFRHGEDRLAFPVPRPNPALAGTHPLLQPPAHGLDDAAFDVAGAPVGIDDHPGIDRRNGVRHPHHAAVAVDFALRHYGHIASEVLVLGKADAAATRAVALLAGCPAS